MEAATDKQQMKALTDNELVEAIVQTGKKQYFGILYDRYANKVYGKCILMVKDMNLAQDLAHDVLIKAFLKLNTFKGKSNFSTWLFQVTYTHCIDHIRKQKRHPHDELEEERFDQKTNDDPGLDEIHEKELLEMRLERLTELMDLIRPEEKMLLLMKYQDNISIHDIAESTELSESAIKMKLKRARDKMRMLYAKHYPAGHE